MTLTQAQTIRVRNLLYAAAAVLRAMPECTVSDSRSLRALSEAVADLNGSVLWGENYDSGC